MLDLASMKKRPGGDGLRLRGEARKVQLQAARDWRERNRARFDAVDRAGQFSDSWQRHPNLPARPQAPLGDA